ncbi:hypothetical protein [Mucilaginibacter sp. SG564]|uniref:hypothetical protein n=1 Tax=Mucilaginibacter sp. SG564 TaxID=2587022 RepID=UPI0015571841|nr:hypothetical protein [Mucilaginibacter sp. SG564]NOW99172.1 hypothetical protein [Mucilaginibacter sp. SG564]
MSYTTIYKRLSLTHKFNHAFPDQRIPNGIIDKTKTRLGISYTAFHDKRHGITITPGQAIIEDAIRDYPDLNLFLVMDGVTSEDVAKYLLSDATYKRIVTTPESFGKIISAAIKIGKLQWLFDEFFLYLDEFHCYASEAFRKDILTPFENDWVWLFKNAAFGSATPFEYSDPRFAKLQRYKILYEEKFGKITIVNDSNPKAALNYMLTHPEIFPGKVYIFFNSVTEIGETIRATGITDVNVYCRDEEKNMANLEEASIYFKYQPLEAEYKKFNFFSCRYNEGWDLKDDETATLILVTDVRIPHSMIGIPFKGFQAVGRLKVPPHKIYHITNNYHKEGMKSFKEIQSKCIYNATKYIEAYNLHRANCKKDEVEDDERLKEMIEPFSKFDEHGNASIHYMHNDQLIYAEYCKQHYKSVTTIKETWQSLNYNTEVVSFDLAPIERSKKTTAQVNKEIVEQYKEWKEHPEQYVYAVASKTIAKHKVEFALLFQAIEILGIDEIEALEYNEQAMKTALINQSNKNAEAKLRIMLIDTFKLNTSYSKKFIKQQLQGFYNELRIQKPTGEIKTATAAQLNEFGLFVLKECKVVTENGRSDNGFEVVKLCYTLQQAA